MKRTVATAIACALTAATVIGSTASMTEAARSENLNLTTEFKFSVEEQQTTKFVLEHSSDGINFVSTDSATKTLNLSLSFDPSALAMKPGAANAVYAPMYIRLGAGTTSEANATLTENQLTDAPFPNSLRSRIYKDVDTCSKAGIAGKAAIQTITTMRGQTTNAFELAAPNETGKPGEPVKLCVEAWMNDNNWLLGGETPPRVTARWQVRAEEKGQ
ncbi:hypothetical protein [Corynebacterium urinipleomorphum]|uniref:hypothetical protein n=1 Tax=Corynebacterium urinipleomorphum TaxID=1852380 RepID=UPI000B354175|nr:hypothetical protein [Corynebacterium urinipleomorphum]